MSGGLRDLDLGMGRPISLIFRHKLPNNACLRPLYRHSYARNGYRRELKAPNADWLGRPRTFLPRLEL